MTKDGLTIVDVAVGYSIANTVKRWFGEMMLEK
jgi:hypothetical protein